MTAIADPDLALTGGIVITLDDERRVIDDGTVSISGNRISAVGASGEVTVANAAQVVDCTGCLVLPGFVDCHSHLAQTLIRSLGEGLDTFTWLRSLAFPVTDTVTRDEATAATRLGALEAVRAGITCVVDNQYMPAEPEMTISSARAMEEIGIRGFAARGMTGTAPPAMQSERSGTRPNYYSTSEELAMLEDLLTGWPADALVGLWPGPLNIAFNDQEMIAGSVDLARRFGTRWHTHCCESPDDPVFYEKAYGTTPIAWLHREGLLGPETTLAHAIWVSEDEVASLGDVGARVAHNPTSNSYLGRGTMPLLEMLSAGAVIGLGTDGPAVGHRQDPFEVMKQAVFMHRQQAVDPSVISSEDVLDLATRGGAEFTGLDVGSLVPGKLADVVVVELSHPSFVPRHRLATTVVNSSTGRDVRTVIVDGKVVVDDGVSVTVDEQEVIAAADQASREVCRRAGV